MDGFLLKLFFFVVAIGILVTVHEFGHFWVARRLGVKVLRFSIGFGAPLRSWRGRDGVEYVIAAIPLGGYVRMLDGREDAVPPEEADRAFDRKPLRVRTAVVLAGPLANFLFAVIAFWGVLVLGETGVRPLVGEVADGSPAALAGVRPGDEIVAVDGESTPTWGLVMQALARAGLSDLPLRLRLRADDGGEREVTLPADAVGDPATAERSPAELLGLRPDRPVVPPVFGEVLPGEPAAQAGIRPGDRILDADGRAIRDWGEWVEYVRERPGRPIRLRVLRDGRERVLDLIPAARRAGDREIGRIGALNAPLDEAELARWRAEYRLGPVEALPVAAARTIEFSWLTLKVLARMVTGEASLQNLSGPLSIADAAGRTASHGLVSFLRFLAVVSISLGVINLLPVPVLDGGHLVYFLIEAVRGSPPPERWLEQGQRFGLAVLAALMALAFYVDIVRFFG